MRRAALLELEHPPLGTAPARGGTLKVCMLAACPFPANHGTPGSIRGMAEAVADLGHEVHIVTYHFGEEISVRGPIVHRIEPWTKERAIVVGPTIRRPLYDVQMIFKTLQVQLTADPSGSIFQNSSNLCSQLDIPPTVTAPPLHCSQCHPCPIIQYECQLRKNNGIIRLCIALIWREGVCGI